MKPLEETRIAVVGGSYAGLCAGLALRCAGADVQVYERSSRNDRVGGGIVVQPEFADYLEAFGYARPETVAVPTVARRFLDRDGAVKHTTPDVTVYTAWDAVLRSLHNALDSERLHRGHALRRFRQHDGGVTLEFDDDEVVDSDLLIGADGVGSVVRQQLVPDLAPSYAGYVGYRGLVPEAALSDTQLDLFRDHFVLYGYPHSHLLCYFIPGEAGERAPGSRRFNWVWYVSHSPAELDALLTDRSGHRHRASLGPGAMADACVAALRQRADEQLPAVLAGAVRRTEAPFVQAIFDLETPHMVHGRALLLGDAAFLVRPHTASGASKAAADAVALAHALQDAGGVTDAALAAWASERCAATRRIVQHGKMIAMRGGLGA